MKKTFKEKIQNKNRITKTAITNLLEEELVSNLIDLVGDISNSVYWTDQASSREEEQEIEEERVYKAKIVKMLKKEILRRIKKAS